MGRYLQDITAVPGDMRSRASPPLTAWGRARLTARDALTHAAGHLRQHSGGRRAPGVTARSELPAGSMRRRYALTAGRDLLHTHLARDPRGARQFRSEWGLVICSPPAERALLAELAWLARQIAAPVHRPGPFLPGPRTPPTRERGLHRRLRVAAGAQRLRAGRAEGRPGLRPPTVTCCSPSRSTPPCPAPSWTAANRSPRCTTP